MPKRKLLTIVVALMAAAALVSVPLTAGGQDGRPDDAKPGAVVAEPVSGATVDVGDWDGDGPRPQDQQILDDLIVDGSICVGFDCVNGESFGFDTIRLKENNTRIKAQDTSTSASFPTQDWQLTFNESSNGGQNKFSIDAISPNSSTPFTIESSNQSHSLYVDDGGRIGFGTANPVVELHLVDGDTPTLRLEQDGSSGFTPQTFDVAANEANFFVRDATNGSKLVFRIKPGAPSESIFVDTNGDVGLTAGTSPAAGLHVKKAVSDPLLLLESTSTGANTTPELHIKADTDPGLRISKTGTAGAGINDWELKVTNQGALAVDRLLGTGTEARFLSNGDFRILGQLLANDGANPFPDYVFASGYQLRSLTDLAAFIEANGHLPGVMSAADVAAEGAINMTTLQLQILEKVEELTLYTLAQQDYIDRLEARIAELEGKGR